MRAWRQLGDHQLRGADLADLLAYRCSLMPMSGRSHKGYASDLDLHGRLRPTALGKQPRAERSIRAHMRLAWWPVNASLGTRFSWESI
jgi:hypothetical protein